MYPRLTTDLVKLRQNMDNMTALCHERGLSCALVSKCVCAAEPIVKEMDESGCDFIADSRIENLAPMKVKKPRYLLRISSPSRAADTVRCSEVSQESEIDSVRLLGSEAARQERRHRVVVMADMGDLREGVIFSDRAGLLELARAVCREDMLELYGLGVNFSCYGGILPDKKNLTALVELAEFLRRETGREIPFVSGGNSSSLTMLLDGAIPKGITNLRIGEGFLLGRETSGGKGLPGFNHDCFTLEAEIIELKRKPSKPIGTSGLNAFGEPVSFPERGEMLRAICALGRQDTEISGLTPRDERIEVLGASSDHLLLNLSELPGARTGDVIAFNVDYGALLHSSTSGYIEKTYINKA